MKPLCYPVNTWVLSCLFFLISLISFHFEKGENTTSTVLWKIWITVELMKMISCLMKLRIFFPQANRIVFACSCPRSKILLTEGVFYSLYQIGLFEFVPQVFCFFEPRLCFKGKSLFKQARRSFKSKINQNLRVQIVLKWRSRFDLSLEQCKKKNSQLDFLLEFKIVKKSNSFVESMIHV